MSTTLKTKSLQPNTHKTQRRLFLEGLERRSVLAGDVWAAQIGSNLFVHGDSDDNGIHIQTMADGTVKVSGLDAGGSPTTINGDSEPFVASGVHSLTRVHLGAGDDLLQIDSEVSSETGAIAGSDSSGDASGDVSADPSATIRGRLNGLLNGIGRSLSNFQAREHLWINTGGGHDTVDATVPADLDVHVAGNLRGDEISIQTIAEADDSSDESAGTTSLNAGATANLSGNVAADAEANADVSLDVAGVDAAFDTNLNAALDAAGQLTAGGIGMNADLDSALIANLAFSPALNSASNLGTSSLLNSDQNLNGSIGGTAALNLAGDGLFDEVGLFNDSSLANIDADLAGQLALANANNFGVTANNVDDFFASLNGQNSLNANANAAIDAGLLNTLGSNDPFSSGLNSSLNTNVNQNLNSAFQSRLGVPLG